MALAIVLVLLVVGSILFHFLSPWWFTPLASNWGTIDDALIITFIVTGIAFVLVNLFMAYAVFAYRHDKQRKSEYRPENKSLEWWLTGITTVGVVAMLAPGLAVWADYVRVPDNAHSFEVVGQQWRWTYRYPGEDGVLGTSDPKHISVDNPFGINPEDPYGQDDVLVADGQPAHVPIDEPVKIVLRSIDVLHDYYVPNFRAKMDLVPGLVTYFWFTPTVAGEYDSICAELCGTGHYTMQGRVIVEDRAAFDTWLAAQPTFAQMLSDARPGTDNQSRNVAMNSE